MTAPRSLQPPTPTSGTAAGVGAVVAQGLVKRFGSTTALDGVSCTIHPGELFGFIGPDGAGKTTLFRILTTLLVPDDGQARVLGEDVVGDLWSLRTRVGYMSGRFSLYPDLSVEENLRFFASVFGTTIAREYDRIAPIYAQLEPFNARRAGALSGGMKQKLALCCALVHRPEILFLDEPTTGVDAVSRREFWDLLGRLKASGLTTVVSTPYMDEADRCDRVALIQRGRLLAIDTPEAIARSLDRPLIAVRSDDRYRALRTLREFPHMRTVFPFGEALHYTDVRPDAPADQVAREVRNFLELHGLTGIRAEATAPTVEDSFMARMGAPEGQEERA
ncbi:MAG TPA: ABC transporter ATP-binding protein [Vicinamibacterales bacterium]|jgi:ABC-type multidrug transport system ATPase subunit|nr:ABC transporter ATP-binding protein [Vicinamibacterales bacterium]